MATIKMPVSSAKTITPSQQAAINRGQSALQAMRPVQAPSRVTIPGPGGFGAKTQQAVVAPVKAPVKTPVKAPVKAPVTPPKTSLTPSMNVSSYIPKPTSGKGSSPITTMYDTTNANQPALYNLSDNQWVPQQPQQVASNGLVPSPGAGKGGPSAGNQPTFNLPNPVQAPPSVSSTTMSQPIGYQNPIGQYQTPAPAQNPPIANGNFGTIQPTPYPVSGIAMPTPNPVPVAPSPSLPGPQQQQQAPGPTAQMPGMMQTPSWVNEKTGIANPLSMIPVGEQYNTIIGPLPGMNNLQGLYGLGRTNPLSAMGGMGGPPQMTFQDYINQGSTPEQAQQMMSQFGPK